MFTNSTSKTSSAWKERPIDQATVGRALIVAGTLTIRAVLADAQTINLSDISAGTGGGFVINGQAAGDRSGICVSSAGDVNGDGLADVFVGAHFSDPAAGINAGRSYVVFGKTGSVAVDLSAVTMGVGGFVVNGQATSDYSGRSVSLAGDVNGDGLADVIVGADLSDPAAGYAAGRSYVVFGKADTAAVDLSAVASGASTMGFVINGQEGSDRSGISVSSAGDVNGDGLVDVIVGAFFSSPSGRTYAGRSYVVFGKTGGADVELSAIDSGIGGFVIDGQNNNDRSGRSVCSAGDVNGDGLADLIVGAYRSDPAAGSYAGRSYVVFGKASGEAVDLSAVANSTSALGFVMNGQEAGDRSGFSVSSAGDVNGDGLADVIVSAHYSTPAMGGADSTRAGRTYVVFGKTSGAAVDLSAVAAGTSTLGFVINGEHPDDRSGFSVSSAGDVNGDALADIIIGGPVSGPGVGSSFGRSYVVFGKTSGAAVDLSALATGTPTLGLVINGQNAHDRSGHSVCSAGDVNGDGLADLIVGAYASDPDAGSSAGRSYVIFSPMVPAASGTYRGRVAAGNPDRQGLGVHRFGDDATIFPDSRAWVDFDAGTGPGLASSSEVVATITRNDAGLTGFDPLTTANVQWQFTSDRTGWSACRVTVRYTDAEIAGLAEGALVLYTAPTAAGPFVPAANFTLTPTRNEAAGEVASMPAVFALSTVPPGGGILDGDANDDGFIDIADVTAIHNDLAGIMALTPDGVANLANIGGVSVGAANAILDHLANGAPLP